MKALTDKQTAAVVADALRVWPTLPELAVRDVIAATQNILRNQPPPLTAADLLAVKAYADDLSKWPAFESKKASVEFELPDFWKAYCKMQTARNEIAKVMP